MVQKTAPFFCLELVSSDRRVQFDIGNVRLIFHAADTK